MRTSATNNIGVAIVVLLFLILIVLVSGFGFWKEVLFILGVVVLGFVVFLVIHFLRSSLEVASFVVTHTAKGESREKTRWTTALRALYRQYRAFFLVSLVSLLLLLSALVKYIVTGKWG